MIPKIIHYCWFGPHSIPAELQACIDSWRRLAPHYRFRRWDESNSPLAEAAFVQAAYKDNKWAIVADYVRLRALYEEGGIYLDTDILLIKPLDELLVHPAFIGAEQPHCLNAAIVGAVPGHPFIRSCLHAYESLCYHPRFFPLIPQVVTRLLPFTGPLQSPKLVKNVMIYPPEYFYPQPYDQRRRPYLPFLTPQSIAVHRWYTSWHSITDELTNFRYRAAWRKIRQARQRGSRLRPLSIVYYGLHLHQLKRHLARMLGDLLRWSMHFPALHPLLFRYTSFSRRKLIFRSPPPSSRPDIRLFTRRGLSFRLDISTLYGHQLWHYLFDRGTERMLASIRPGDHILDIGPAAGYPALQAARRAERGQVDVYADDAEFLLVDQHRRLNRITNVQLHPLPDPRRANMDWPAAPVNWIRIGRADLVATCLPALAGLIQQASPRLLLSLDDDILAQHGSSARAVIAWLEALDYRAEIAAGSQPLRSCYFLRNRTLEILGIPSEMQVNE